LSHVESIAFNVILSPHFPVILGLSWLKLHNPLVNWRKLTLQFPSDPDRQLDTLPSVKSVERVPDEFVSVLQMDNLNSAHSMLSKNASIPVASDVANPQHKLHKHIKVAERILIHNRFGHRNYNDIRMLMSNKLNLRSKPDTKSLQDLLRHFRPFLKLRKPIKFDLLERVTVDCCGPLPVCSINGELYFVTFSDDASRWKFTFLMKRKSEVFSIFKDFKTMIEKRTSKQIKILFGDNASEFVSRDFTRYLAEEGNTWQSTVPHSSEQNGISERGHLTLMDSARSMLIHAKLPKQFWGPAVLTASHIHNICPHPNIDGTTPHEQLHGRKPDVSYLRVFGCDAYGLAHAQSKLEPRAKKCIFIGYSLLE